MLDDVTKQDRALHWFDEHIRFHCDNDQYAAVRLSRAVFDCFWLLFSLYFLLVEQYILLCEIQLQISDCFLSTRGFQVFHEFSNGVIFQHLI